MCLHFPGRWSNLQIHSNTYAVNAGQEFSDEASWGEGDRKSMPKYWFLHRQINTEWFVLAIIQKRRLTGLNMTVYEDKLFYTSCFSRNAFLSTAYSQITSTDTCKNIPIFIQVWKTSSPDFPTVNSRREEKKKKIKGSSYERRMCLNNLAWRSSALCANMEIWQVDQSKDLAQIFTNPALCTCVPAVIKHPFSPLSPESLQQFVEGLGKRRPFWQALYSPPLYSQTQSGRLQR